MAAGRPEQLPARSRRLARRRTQPSAEGLQPAQKRVDASAAQLKQSQPAGRAFARHPFESVEAVVFDHDPPDLGATPRARVGEFGRRAHEDV